MKLVVLAGAKKGAAVPIKKSSFVIGRSKECALRAGSDAISRKHCELKNDGQGATVRDLGSRNGTYVNGEKIEGVYTLSNGDTLKIGPLEFRFEFEGEINKTKAPKVRSVGEAVAREATKSGGSGDGLGEDDISEWLLGDGGPSEMPSIGETLTMRNDETRVPLVEDTDQAETEALETSETDEESEAGEAAEEEKGKKKGPGKLPFRPEEPKAKDSREAAQQVLREMARRR